jgi:hypothetical protein
MLGSVTCRGTAKYGCPKLGDYRSSIFVRRTVSARPIPTILPLTRIQIADIYSFLFSILSSFGREETRDIVPSVGWYRILSVRESRYRQSTSEEGRGLCAAYFEQRLVVGNFACFCWQKHKFMFTCSYYAYLLWLAILNSTTCPCAAIFITALGSTYETAHALLVGEINSTNTTFLCNTFVLIPHAHIASNNTISAGTLLALRTITCVYEVSYRSAQRVPQIGCR